MHKNNIAKIGQKAPRLQISDWVAGKPTNLDQLLGRTVLIEVFQVNCPGCFLYSLPQAIELHQRYNNKDLYILGMATAFEDYDKNNVANLELLIKQNRVIGETLRVLEKNNQLIDGKLPYKLPFPVVMDRVTKQEKEFTDDEITTFINQQIPDFSGQKESQKKLIWQRALDYLQNQLYTPETFSLYALQGTPSHIIIDKHGILRASEFGHFSDLEWFITTLLEE